MRLWRHFVKITQRFGGEVEDSNRKVDVGHLPRRLGSL